MKNREKYANEIIEFLVEDGYKICAFRRKNVLKSIDLCNEYNCYKCHEICRQWLDEEAIEEIELTQLEYDILKAYSTRMKYIARDSEKYNYIWLFEEKANEICESSNLSFWNTKGECVPLKLFSDLFQFIKPNEEPYLIADILERAKVVEDE